MDFAAAIIRKISDGEYTGRYLLVFRFNNQARAGQLLSARRATILDEYRHVEEVYIGKNNVLCIRFKPRVKLVTVQKAAVGIAHKMNVLAVTTTVAPDSKAGLEDLGEIINDAAAKATEFIDEVSAKIKEGLNEFGALLRQLGDSVQPPNKQD